MGFETIVDLDCDTTTALGGVNKKTGKPNPKSVEGYFVGSRQIDSPKSKTGKAYLHVFQTASGNIGVWGKTDLDRKMGNVPPGVMARVSFNGMKPTKNGDMYTFKVEVDKSNTIEVNLPSSEDNTPTGDDTAAFAGADEEEASLDADEGEEEAFTPPSARTPAARASAPDAARQAKVQALLNSRRK